MPEPPACSGTGNECVIFLYCFCSFPWIGGVTSQAGTLACGLEDGTVIILDVTTDKVAWISCVEVSFVAQYVCNSQSFAITSDSKAAVVDIQWDPLSANYFLVAFSTGTSVCLLLRVFSWVLADIACFSQGSSRCLTWTRDQSCTASRSRAQVRVRDLSYSALGCT